MTKRYMLRGTGNKNIVFKGYTRILSGNQIGRVLFKGYRRSVWSSKKLS